MDEVKRDAILEKVKNFLDDGFQQIDIIVRDVGYSIIPTRTTATINNANNLEDKE